MDLEINNERQDYKIGTVFEGGYLCEGEGERRRLR
jgi:hypothetical protein